MTHDEACIAKWNHLPVQVKKRKGHQPLSALIKILTHDSAVVLRSDGAIRTYLLKNIHPLQPGGTAATVEQNAHEIAIKS